MNQEQIDAIRQQLAEFLKICKYSQRQAARELGVSITTLNFFLKGTYIGDNADIAQKAEQFIRMGTARQEVIQVPDICLTVKNTEAILHKCKIAHVNNEVLLIYGPAGCGKTTALEYYANQNNGVLYIQADATTSSPRCILQLILSEMGEAATGTTNSMMQRIISKLRNTNQLVIIDEAQHLTERAFDTLRALNDKAHVGLVYAGNPSILQRMYGRQQEDYDQVYSRVTYKCSLKNVYTLEDIRAIYAGHEINKDCMKYLYGVAKRKGGLRIMTRQCKLAENIAASLKEHLSMEHLEAAARMMGMTEGVA